MPLTDEQAAKRLKMLLGEPGALRMILPFHVCQEGRVTDTAIAQDRAFAAQQPKLFGHLAKRCDEHAAKTGHDLRHPSHYESVPVKRIERDEKRPDWLVAYADDGEDNSTCRGAPTALLARLTEHERV